MTPTTLTSLYVPDNAETLNGTNFATPLEAMRAQLRAQGVDGWSEIALTGYWQGMPEPVTRIDVIAAPHPLAFWREILRMVMPDEDAVLVTRQDIVHAVGY